jgi:putative peptidoglycan lipid II flippase
MSENDRLIKTAGVIGAATLLSRILGFVRDAVIAWYFGASPATDAFIAAFRIPNLLRRLFGEGSLSSAFVPVFTDCLIQQGRNEALRFARSAIWFLSAILIIIVVLGILFAPLLARIIAPGFTDTPDRLGLTILLTRVMFPYIFFIGLVALCMGILNVLGHFAAPALAPVLLNLSMIAAVFFISPHLKETILGLAIGVVIGGFVQLTLQLPFVVQKGLKFWRRAVLIHPELKRVGKMMVPVMLGGAVYQLNILIGTLLGSLLNAGSVSYLYFADRLVQFPLGIFAIATATALLPSLARQASAKDIAAVKDTFAYAFKLILFITIPAMFGLIILRMPIITLLFQRGEFDAQATRLTADALLYYAIGLWAFSSVRIVVSTFFAMQDTGTPVKMAVISVITNAALGIGLMKPLAHGGLALATSLASMLNLGLLLTALSAKLGSLGWANIAHSAVKTLVSSVVMGIAVWGVSKALIPADNPGVFTLSIGLMISIAVGLIAFVAASYLIKNPELMSLITEARNSLKKI